MEVYLGMGYRHGGRRSEPEWLSEPRHTSKGYVARDLRWIWQTKSLAAPGKVDGRQNGGELLGLTEGRMHLKPVNGRGLCVMSNEMG